MSVLVAPFYGGSDLSYTGTVTVGTATVSAKGSGGTQYGYSTTAWSINGSAYGSISPSTVSGFTILACRYEIDSPSGATQIVLIVNGDSSAYAANMTVKGNAVGLGAGVFGSGVTTYTKNTVTNFFGTTGTAAVVIT